MLFLWLISLKNISLIHFFWKKTLSLIVSIGVAISRDTHPFSCSLWLVLSSNLVIFWLLHCWKYSEAKESFHLKGFVLLPRAFVLGRLSCPGFYRQRFLIASAFFSFCFCNLFLLMFNICIVESWKFKRIASTFDYTEIRTKHRVWV